MRDSALVRVQPDIVVNVKNNCYIELTGKESADIHFVGKTKPLHLNPNQAESLRDYVAEAKSAE